MIVRRLSAILLAAGLCLPASAMESKSPYRPVKLTQNAKTHYKALWGVDRLKAAAPGGWKDITRLVRKPARPPTVDPRDLGP